MRLIDSVTELTTAATDAALALLCGAALWRLRSLPGAQRWKRSVWAWVLTWLAFASLLGSAVHAVVWPRPLLNAIWGGLYLSLGLTVGAFGIGVLCDARGEVHARKAAPWIVAVGAGFAVLTIVTGGAFLVFVVFESAVMLGGLAVYGGLAVTRRLAGAGLVAAGIAVTIVAGIVQASRLSVVAFVPFDHNGLFHLVQLVGTLLLVVGIRRGLVKDAF